MRKGQPIWPFLVSIFSFRLFHFSSVLHLGLFTLLRIKIHAKLIGVCFFLSHAMWESFADVWWSKCICNQEIGKTRCGQLVKPIHEETYCTSFTLPQALFTSPFSGLYTLSRSYTRMKRPMPSMEILGQVGIKNRICCSPHSQSINSEKTISRNVGKGGNPT